MMRYAKRWNQMEKQYHIGLSSHDGAKYALLPGDPGRVLDIAEFLEDPMFVCSNREFTTYAGKLLGQRVLVTSTGIGGPSASIALEELYRVGVRTCIRIGTCGAIQKEILGGDLIIPNGSVRMEGTSKEYAPIEFPAVPDFTVTSALVEAAKKLQKKYHVGVIQSKDSFYGQHNPEKMPVSYELLNKWEAWIRLGCLGSDMESAALFIAGSTLRMRIGCVLKVVWNQEREKIGLDNPHCMSTKSAIETGVYALKSLIMQENE